MTLGYLHNLDNPLVLENTDNAGSQARYSFLHTIARLWQAGRSLGLEAVSLSDLDHSEEREG